MTAIESIDVLDLHPTLMPTPPSWCHAPARANCPHALRFCAQLHSLNKPVVVPVRPELLYGDGPYPMGRCYDEVDNYVNRAGGAYQHGWMIWQAGGIYLRAYHHCVHWDGQKLTDVSFQTHREILFLPTSEPAVSDEAYLEAKRRNDSDGIPCKYHPLSDSALARRIVSLHEEKDRAVKYSPEWFGLLQEVASLEAQFHEWDKIKSAAVRRRKETRRWEKSGRHDSWKTQYRTGNAPRAY